MEEVSYYLFFLIEKEKSYASAQIAQIQFSFNLAILYVLFIVLGGFLTVLGLMLYIALRSSKNITNAIDIMTEYTQRLKQATNVEGKRRIINDISEDELFVEIGKKYDRMQQAQKALIKRHKDTDPSLQNSEKMNRQQLLISQTRCDSQAEANPIKTGEEVKTIQEWTELYDELDELKKIFFEFLKRWTD